MYKSLHYSEMNKYQKGRERGRGSVDSWRFCGEWRKREKKNSPMTRMIGQSASRCKHFDLQKWVLYCYFKIEKGLVTILKSIRSSSIKCLKKMKLKCRCSFLVQFSSIIFFFHLHCSRICVIYIFVIMLFKWILFQY